MNALKPSAIDRGVSTAAGSKRWPWLVALFRRWVKGYLRRHFHSVRVARDTTTGRDGVANRGHEPEAQAKGRFPFACASGSCAAPSDRVDPDGPLVVVLNHPSWWDPLVGMVLSELFPVRTHFAPIDAKALGRYRFFERLGFYGVEQGTPRGAISFLRTTTAILTQPGAAVWITAQGRFTDPRQRPPGLRPGIGHLLTRLDRGTVLPLALEYPFWEESKPEALARFGEPISITCGISADEWVARLEIALAETQDALALDACSRNADAFEPLLAGRVGVGGIYDAWRSLLARLRGETFRAEHGEEDLSRSLRGAP